MCDMRIGKRLYFSPGFGAMILIIYFLDNSFVLPLALSVLIHEAGHICGIKLSGVEIKKFKFQCAGLLAEYDGRAISYPQEILCALLGPLFSLIFSLAFSVIGRFYDYEPAFITAGISFTVFAFNMLPVSVLDGGRALYMFIAYFGGISRAASVRKVLDIAVTLAVFVFGIVLFVEKRGNLALAAASVMLFVLLCCKKGENSVKSYAV